MEINRKTKIIAIAAAVVMIVAAIVLNGMITAKSPYRAVVEELTSRGYVMTEDDLFSVGRFESSSIAQVLAGQDLAPAVEAGKAGGFPSDVNAVGDISMLLLSMENQDIITIFLRDGQVELCFVQRLDDSALRPLDGAQTN